MWWSHHCLGSNVGSLSCARSFLGCIPKSYLWPRPCGPHWGAAVSVAGLPPGRGGLGAARVSLVVYVGLAGPLDALDVPRLLPSSAAPAAHPPLAYRPAGTTQQKPAESTSSKSLEPTGDFKRLANCTIIAEDSLCFLSKWLLLWVDLVQQTLKALFTDSLTVPE